MIGIAPIIKDIQNSSVRGNFLRIPRFLSPSKN
jgi:hypothetical protein